VFPGGTAAKVNTSNEDGSVVEAFIIKRMIRLFARFRIKSDVIESVFSESVKGDTLHEACRDDTVRVDVSAWDRNGGAGNLCDGCDSHDYN
jgi:hypothetical protein